MDLVSQFNSHKYLYLDRLAEIEDLKLEVWIDEARVKYSEVRRESPFSELGTIETDAMSKRYKFTFDGYIAYSVLNESYEADPEEVERVTNNFDECVTSPFLEYLSKIASLDTAEFIAESRVRHFQLNCLNQIINVVSCHPPEIEEVNA